MSVKWYTVVFNLEEPSGVVVDYSVDVSDMANNGLEAIDIALGTMAEKDGDVIGIKEVRVEER